MAAYLVELLLRDSTPTEEEISQLEDDEAVMFLEEMGLAEAGLDRLIKAGYELLHLETYFTVGPKEARAWTVSAQTKRVSDLLCMSNLAHASKLKEHDDNDDIQGSIRRAAERR